MTRKEAIEYCLSLPGVYEDYPFDAEWTAMRHSVSQKCFAFLFEREGKVFANLKCEPMRAEFLREMYRGVTPAYHMNKVHWNSVYLDSDLPDDVIKTLISDSYHLTDKKKQNRLTSNGS